MTSNTAGVLHARQIGIEGIAVLTGQSIGAVGLLAAVRLLTTLLAPAEYGTFALGLTIVLLASQMLFGPIANAILRFYPAAEDRGELPSFWSAVRNLAGLASIVSVILSAIVVAILHILGYTVTPILAVSATAFAVLSGWETLLDFVQSAQRRRWTVAWHQGVRQLLRPALAAMLILAYRDDGVAWAFAGYAVASGLIVLSQCVFARDHLHFLLKRDASSYWGRLLQFAIPFTTWGLFTWAQLSSDRWALEVTTGISAVGRYAVLVQLGAQPLILLGTAAAQLFEPLIYKRASLGADARHVRSAYVLNARVTALFAVAVLTIVLVEWVGRTFIFGVVVSPEYADASPLLPIAALSGGLFSLGQLYAVGSVVLGSSRELIQPKIATAVLGILLNVLGAYAFGVTGVLAAGVLSAFVFGTWVVVRSVAKYSELAV